VRRPLWNKTPPFGQYRIPGHQPDFARASAGLRAAVATKLSAAMASIKGMMVNQPRRAINRRQSEK